MKNFICGGEKFDVINENDNEKYRLIIMQDEDAESPREWDNVGHMICFHSRYRLGDKHDYDNPSEFIKSLVKENSTSQQQKKIINYVKDGHAESIRLIYDKSTKIWILETYWGYKKEWCEAYTEEAPFKYSNDMLEAIIENSEDSDLNVYLEFLDIVILPLYLYDHSGLTISTGEFSCPWDSGQVGWIYCTKKEAFAEYGIFDEVRGFMPVTDENWEKAAIENLTGEVKNFDTYLRGEVYGFKIEKEVKCECCGNIEYEDIDSCWGFYGDSLEDSGILDNIGGEFTIIC